MTRDQARALDAADPLRHLRERFHIPDGVIYLDGNSLGALPRATVARQQEVVTKEWGESLIRSWNEHQWIEAPQRIGAKIAPLIGAKPHEVIVADSTTSSTNTVRSRSGGGERKWRFCQIAPPTVLGIPTKWCSPPRPCSRVA